MAIKGLDAEKCRRRNRLDARRGVNSVPLRFLSGPPALDAAGGYGFLPTAPDDVMAAINNRLPEGAPALTADDVFVHFVDAANGNFIRKYFMFFSDRTLKNFANDAIAGIAFMNSHRTGSISTPTELPFGKSFGGMFNTDAGGLGHAYIGFYMLKGVHPNGASGPSTDDLHAMIAGGTVPDVSVGVPSGGAELCDICGNELGSTDPEGNPLCTHAPGTASNMTAEQRQQQLARGVPGGLASFTLDDAHLSETSAVYDGAVPGAGVRKVLTLARVRRLSATDVAQARSVYAQLLNEGDLNMDEVEESMGNAFERALRRVGFSPRQPAMTANRSSGAALGQPFDGNLDDYGAPLQAVPVEDTPQYRALQAENERIKREQQDQAAKAARTFAATALRSAVQDADRIITDARALPAARPALIALFARAYSEAQGSVATFSLGDAPAADPLLDTMPTGVTFALDGAVQTSTVELLRAVFAGVNPHELTHASNIPSDTKIQLAGDTSAQKEAEQQAIDDLNLSRTASGRKVLAMREKNGGRK